MGNDESIGMHAGVKLESLSRRMRDLRFAEKLRTEMIEPEEIFWDDRIKVEGALLKIHQCVF